MPLPPEQQERPAVDDSGFSGLLRRCAPPPGGRRRYEDGAEQPAVEVDGAVDAPVLLQRLGGGGAADRVAHGDDAGEVDLGCWGGQVWE